MSERAVPLPIENPDLIGQEKAEKILLSAYENGKLAGGWLLAGPQGIGKATLAYRLARFLLSETEDTGQDALFGDLPSTPNESLSVSEESSVFQRVLSGAHPQLKILERGLTETEMKKVRQATKAGTFSDTPDDMRKRAHRAEIVVDDVRNILSFLAMTSADGSWRVVIVDSVDEMNRNAANALLKILEEPPEKTIFILISHNPAKLLPTIRSRCRKILMPPLTDDKIDELLTRYLPETGDEERGLLKRQAEGRIGKAISLAETGGLSMLETIDRLMLDITYKKHPTGLMAFAEKTAADEQEYAIFQEVFLSRLRQTAKAPYSESDADPFIQQVAPLYKADVWAALFQDTVNLFQKTAGLNLDKKQTIIESFSSLASGTYT